MKIKYVMAKAGRGRFLRLKSLWFVAPNSIDGAADVMRRHHLLDLSVFAQDHHLRRIAEGQVRGRILGRLGSARPSGEVADVFAVEFLPDKLFERVRLARLVELLGGLDGSRAGQRGAARGPCLARLRAQFRSPTDIDIFGGNASLFHNRLAQRREEALPHFRVLNYSSDIDLILFFDLAKSRVITRDGLQPFFSRLARDLVRILEERTADGYVFRTDLRLRPDPGSTPPAMSIAAAITYYETVGQNWERAALIKARPVAGDRAAGERLLRELNPFIWRKHLDFAAIQDIHSIKRQINAYRGGGRIAVEGHDIKIGRGGIREIEFFAQTQQLIWGGRMPELRVRGTCEALRRLAETGRIDPKVATTLIADYRFLRRLEHRLQMVDDAQTHRLPDNRDGIARVATFLGYRSAEAFSADLTAHLGSVERHYAELFEQAPSLAGPGNLVFTGSEDDPDTLATLSRLGFARPADVAALVRSWHHGRMRATRSQRAREILTELVPELLRIFGATSHPDEALRRFDQFLTRLAAGVQLFSLFQGNPGLLALVADVMAGAPRLADQLAQRPALLDAVLTREFSAALPERPVLAADLDRMVAGVDDFADILDVLRRWAGERRFQVGVQLLRRSIDGEAAGKAFADIAEVALAALVPAVEHDFARRHGRVPGGAFAVIGMGRLGSREMTLASDLDLILIYDAPADSVGSDGAQPLASSAYYARLSQRLIGAITAPTAEGPLYAVDMRLRPSGSSGPIASSLESFDRYQRDAAWTWEHMALTRARTGRGRGRAAPARRRDDRYCSSLAARPAAVGGRRRRDAAAGRRRESAASAMGFEAPSRRPDRSRIYRSIPDAARGRRRTTGVAALDHRRAAGVGGGGGALGCGRARTE